MRYIILLLLGFLMYQKTEAQIANYQPLSYEKFRIMGVPQMLILHGLRIDIDIPQHDGKEWVILSPAFYYKDRNDSEFTDDYDKLIGGRLGVAKRIHFMNGQLISGWYISYGAEIEYFNITKNVQGWNTVQEEGAEYLHLSYSDKKFQAIKPGIEFTVGQVFELSENVMVDCYLGTAFRYCFFDGTADEKSQFAGNMFGKTHSGTLFLGGVRVGISVPKLKRPVID
jgi:hypothetical protein